MPVDKRILHAKECPQHLVATMLLALLLLFASGIAQAQTVASVTIAPTGPNQIILNKILAILVNKPVTLNAIAKDTSDKVIQSGVNFTWLDPVGHPNKAADGTAKIFVDFEPGTSKPVTGPNAKFRGIKVSESSGLSVSRLDTVSVSGVVGNDRPVPSADLEVRVVDVAARFELKQIDSAGLEDVRKPEKGLILLSNAPKPVVLRAAAYKIDNSWQQSALETWTIEQTSNVLQFDVDPTHTEVPLLTENKLTATCFNSTPVKLVPRGPGKATIIIRNHELIDISGLTVVPELRIEVTVPGDVKDFNLNPAQITPLYKDQVVQIKPQIKDANGVDLTASTPIVWTSSNTNIVDFTTPPTKDKTVLDEASGNGDNQNSVDPNKYVVGKATGQAVITATVKDQNGTPHMATCAVNVVPALNRIVVGSPGVVLEGQEIHLTLQYRDSDGNLVKDKVHIPDITADLKHLTARLDPADPNGGVILVRGLTAGAGILTIKLKNELAADVSLTVPIQVQAVVAFKPIKVSLDIMDEETASQLFGQRTSKEFYAVRVRLLNNLDQFGAQFVGQSILAYSESIEAGIKLEKRYDPRTNSQASYEATHKSRKGKNSKDARNRFLKDDAVLDTDAVARGLFHANANDAIALAVHDSLKAKKLLDMINPDQFSTTLRESLNFALNSVLREPELFQRLDLSIRGSDNVPSLSEPTAIFNYNVAILRKSFSSQIRPNATLERAEANAESDPSVPAMIDPRLWANVTEKDFLEPFTRSLENDDNTVRNDKRFRGHPNVTVFSAAGGANATTNPITINRNAILDLSPFLATQAALKKQKINVADLLWKSNQPQVATVGHDNGIVFGHEAGLAVITGTTISDETYLFLINVTETGTPSRPQVIARYLPTQLLDIDQSLALTIQEDQPTKTVGTAALTDTDIPNAKSLADSFFKPKEDDLIGKAVHAALGAMLLESIDSSKVTDAPTLLHNLVTALNSILKKSDLFLDKNKFPITTVVKPLSAKVTHPETILRYNRAVLSKNYPGQIGAYQAGSDITWESTTEAVAQVEPDSAIVTAKYPGTALILAKRDGKVIFGTVIVVPEKITGELPPSVFEQEGKLEYLRHRFRYRPYSFEMMINTIDPRDEKTSRTKGFKFANALAMVGSFFTNVFAGQQTDAHRILNATSSMLIPGFEKLYPSMKDTERQNFVSMTMRPIEEIAFGADISRVLFFPKHEFHGILPGYQVRISEIDTSVFNIRVAIVDKTKALNLNAAGN